MTRPLALAGIAVFLLAAPIHAADPPATTPSNGAMPTTNAAPSKTFDQWKADGDRAMAAGRLNDAIRAYDEALEIKSDSLVYGRMGLAFMMFEDPKIWREAATFLEIAVSDAAGVSAAERREFFNAYERVRRHVCKVDVITNDISAMVDLGDGRAKLSNGAFWSFIGPGGHVLIASLKGRDDIRKPYECANGVTITLHIEFPMPPAPTPKTITVVQPGKETKVIIREPARESPTNAAIARASTSDGAQWRFALGPSVLFNAAPSPAFGFSGLITHPLSYRQGFTVAIDVGILAAWTAADIASAPLRTTIIAAEGAICARYRFVFGCPLVMLGTKQQSSTDSAVLKPGTMSDFIYGGGLRLGIEHMFSHSFGFRAHGEMLGLGESADVDVKGYGSLWTGTGIWGSATIGLVGRF